MSSVQQFHKALNSLKFSDLRHFEELENALTTRKTHLTHLKQQHIGDLGADVFKNPDISQIIFKFKRESNRLDQVERNKRDVVHELNTLFRWELPTYAQRCGDGKGRDCLVVPTSLKLFWQTMESPEIGNWTKYVLKKKDPSAKLATLELAQADNVEWGSVTWDEALWGWVGEDGGVHIEALYFYGGYSSEIFNFLRRGQRREKPRYLGRTPYTALSNFKQWVLKQEAKKPYGTINHREMREYTKKYNYDSKKYDEDVPWFEFIQNNMRIE